ncbi:MAG: HDOD domain-containing protein [Planctomycetaceae bacterium]|nr:MAG: HDOD domain-containing protein [Planctomycetaceae bacterium]
MDAKTFFRKLDRIYDIPTIPAVALKVDKMLQNYDVSINELSKVISKDQSIVTKILKLVNSAFYGFRTRISNIPHAMVLLGFNTVRNAIISIAIIDSLSFKESIEGFDIQDFWRHSVAVAVVSRVLAEKTRLSIPDEAFVGGLLHDMGKVILARYFTDLFQQVWSAAHKEDMFFYETEKTLLPATHPQIGAHMAGKWRLPANLIEIIKCHHEPIKGTDNFNLVLIVHAADVIVNNFSADLEFPHDFSAIHEDAAEIMSYQLKTVSEWFPEVADEIESACEFFLEEGRDPIK